MGHRVSEAFSLQEIADLWRRGELDPCLGGVHGHWRIRELEPFVTHRTRRFIDPELEQRMESEGFGEEPIIVRITRDSMEVMQDAERLRLAEIIFGRGFLVPVRFMFLESRDGMPILRPSG